MPFDKRLLTLKRTFHPRKIKNFLLHYALKGNNVTCPCCGSSYITFLPAGIRKRANAACIKCGSLERHRNLWLFFADNKHLLNKQMKLLHAAPEKIFYDRFSAQQNIDYYAIDLNPADYNYGIKTMKMDLTSLDFEDNFFDAILCSHVLEHIPDDSKAMKEMYRTLKPSGWAILNVPVKEELEKTFEDVLIRNPKKQLELFGQPDHVRIYGRDYTDRLRNAGFIVEAIQYASKFNHNEQFKYGLEKHETIYFCTRQ